MDTKDNSKDLIRRERGQTVRRASQVDYRMLIGLSQQQKKQEIVGKVANGDENEF